MKTKNLLLTLGLSLSVVISAAACGGDPEDPCKTNPGGPGCTPELDDVYISNLASGGDNLSIAAEPILLGDDETYQLYAVSDPVEAKFTPVWSSSDNEVISVTQTGLVSYVGDGLANIIVRDEDNASISASVSFRASSVDVELLNDTLDKTFDYLTQGVWINSAGTAFADHNATYGFYKNINDSTPTDSYKVTADGSEYSGMSANYFGMNYVRTGHEYQYAFWGKEVIATDQSVSWGAGDPLLYTNNGGNVASLYYNGGNFDGEENQLHVHVDLTSAMFHLWNGEFDYISETELSATAEFYRNLYTITDEGNVRFSFADLDPNPINANRRYMMNQVAIYSFLTLATCPTIFVDTVGAFEIILDNDGEVEAIKTWDAPYAASGGGYKVKDHFTENELTNPTYLKITDVGTTTINARILELAAAITNQALWDGIADSPLNA